MKIRIVSPVTLHAETWAIALKGADRGFTVERRYFDAACDPETTACEPITGIPAGGRVRVELTVVVDVERAHVSVFGLAGW